MSKRPLGFEKIYFRCESISWDLTDIRSIPTQIASCVMLAHSPYLLSGYVHYDHYVGRMLIA